MDRIKVLHLMSTAGNWEPFIRVAGLAASLREFGIDSRIVAPDHSRLQELAEGAGVRVVEYTLEQSINPLRWRDLSTMIQETKAHILHVHDPEAASMTGRAGMFLPKMPMVASRYDIRSAISSAEYGAKIGAVMCSSETLAEKYRQAGAEANKLHVIPDGVNLPVVDYSVEERPAIRAFFRDTYCREKEKPLLVVAIAPLDDIGGQESIIQTMPGILAVLPQAHLFLMGEGPNRDLLQQRRKELSLKRDVTLLEPDKAYHRLLAAADVYVSWAKDDVSGMMVQAAMAAGRGVVLRNSGCYHEMAENGATGVFVPEDTVDSLQAALLELLQSRTRREKLGALAKAHAVKHFNIREQGKKATELYRSLG